MNMPGELLLSEYSDYEKILVVDQDYVVFGGNPWLSKTGYQYDSSYMIADKELASKELERVVLLLETNHAKSIKKSKKLKEKKSPVQEPKNPPISEA